MRDNNLLGAGLMLASGAGISAAFGWLAVLGFIMGVLTLGVAALINNNNGEDSWL